MSSQGSAVNTESSFGGYALAATLMKRLALDKGLTVEQLFDSDLDFLDFYLSHSFTQPGRVEGSFSGGMTFGVNFTGDFTTITRIEVRLDGTLGYLWTGSMSAAAFLADEWPVSVSNGSDAPDWLFVNNGNTVFGLGGNDIIDIYGSGAVSGGLGQDAFVFSVNQGNVTVRDYQVGEKLVFDNYASLAQLVAQVTGISAAAGGGSKVDFGGANQPSWSLTFENFSLDALRVEDILVGVTGVNTVFAPLDAAFGF